MKLILSFILISFTEIYSQDIPSTSSGDLLFYVDYASFKGKEGKTYQEFYLMIHADQLNFINNENLSDKNADFKVSAVIKNSSDEVISDKAWNTTAQLSIDSVDLKSLVVYDQWAELLNPGTYKISVNIVEQKNMSSGHSEFIVNIPGFNTESLSASLIEFISKVEQKNEESHFKKNGRVIIPNPWRRYGLLIPKLSFYYELYNIESPAEDKFLSIDYSIINNDNIEVKSLSDIEVKKSDKNISVIHGVDLNGLSSGIYTLTAKISDTETNQECSVSRPFEIIQIDYLTKTNLLTEEDAETGGKLLEYFATPKEQEIYSNLSLQGKAQFLINFWKEKDTFPDTPENEFLENVKQRYLYANQHFGWGNTEGYKTEKGRVLISYGMPDEIESYFYEADTAPYEVWTYTKDKRFFFVFGDKNSNGNFILLHSTKEGEISDYNWKDYLRAF